MQCLRYFAFKITGRKTLTNSFNMSREILKSFYARKRDFWPWDNHTAASLGDVMHFVKNDMGKDSHTTELPNSSGWTSLMYACGKGHSSLVRYLLVSGAQREFKTHSGITPLMLAITSGNYLSVHSVFHASNIEDTDYRKWTPLFYAVHFTQEKCLHFLIQKGANVNVVDYQNETPLMMAIKMGVETMVQLILNSATNLHTVSFNQESALTLANELNCPRINLLIQGRLQYLNQTTPDKADSVNSKCKINMNSNSSHGHSTPSLKHQLKTHIKLGKSLSYSPGKALKCTARISKNSSSPWKILPKKLWSPQPRPQSQVRTFLEKLGLEKYWPIFRDEEVDFETLLTLNDENLLELGIRLFGPRKKIVLAIQQLRMEYAVQ